jgi:transketolase
MPTTLDFSLLEEKAKNIRVSIIKMLVAAKSGHPGGSLGLADLFSLLYFSVLNHDPEDPTWSERDRLVLSNGHVVPVRYAAMAESGYIPHSKLITLRKLGSPLQGHPERTKIPALETTSGPLGSGLGQAVGMALGAKIDNKRFRVYCVASDGEHQEGNHWESVMFAAKYKLSNLTLFVDRNYIQIGGRTEDVMPLEPLREKYQSFNWNVLSSEGHDFLQLSNAIAKARSEYLRPTVVICHTVPGKGVSFMEGRYEWHGKSLSEEDGKRALKELLKVTKKKK